MYLRDPIYLNGKYGRRTRRTSPLRQIGNALFIALVVGTNYYVFFYDEAPPPAPVMNRPEVDSTPEIDEQVPDRFAPASEETEPEPSAVAVAAAREFSGRLKRGDTVFRVLQDQGIDQTVVSPVMTAMKDVFDFRKAQVGHRFEGEIDGQGQLKRFQFQTGPLDVYEVRMEDADYIAVKKHIPVETRITRLGCEMGTSLFASLTRCGEGPELAQRVVDLLSFDVDFFQEIRQGDVLRMIVEKVHVDGRFLKYGRIRAARYEGKFGTVAAYFYKDQDGREAYYTRQGRALKKEFLKTPLKYTRISSGFTHRRFHPTLHRWKKHLAIDYAAPVNTPVQAVASGVVRYVGKKGASGNLVIIDHHAGYSSYYAHLNKFGRIEVGDQVSQRTLVGYVGQTGRATGPHLHFALKHGKKWVNPLNVKNIEAAPISKTELGRFEGAVQPLIEALQETEVQGYAERRG